MDFEIGKHNARAVGGVLGTTGKNSEQVGVEFVFTDDGPNAGKHITWYGYFSDKTIDRTIESLRYAGWKGTDLSDLSDLSAEDTPVVQLVLELEDTEKGPRVKVRWVNRGGSGGVAIKDKMDEGSAKSFAERMKAHVLAYDQQKGTPTRAAPAKPAAPKAPAPTPGSDIDVPF
jgi:hypothetical protein